MDTSSKQILKSSTSRRLLQAFVNGSAGGLIGGLMYYPLCALFQFGGTEYSSITIIALAFALGVFEMVRVSHLQFVGRWKTCVLCFMAAAIIVLLGMGETVDLQTDATPDKPQLLTNAAFTRSI